MIFKRFYEDSIAQASFLVGCKVAGEAIVIDPNRNLEQYEKAAAAEGLRISAVTETHIHADFISGSRELAQRTGAKLYLSAAGSDDWRYGFLSDAMVVQLRSGDVIQVGKVELQAIHTPGHTPEHLSFLMTDAAASSQPLGAFTGDFIFAGEVGRPDLMEKVLDREGSARSAASLLYDSIQKFSTMAAYLLIWPGHGAGSACGKSLGGAPVSSLGYEKLVNWAFQARDRENFIDQVLEGQPAPPRYFAFAKKANQQGPAPAPTKAIEPLHLPDLQRALSPDALLLDVRDAQTFASSCVAGAINIPLGKVFLKWVGQLFAPDKPIFLICDSGVQAEMAKSQLQLIGFDIVIGWFQASELPQTTLSRINVDQMPARHIVLDVRMPDEFQRGHIEGAINIPLPELTERLHSLPNDKAIVVHCQGGARSAIAASVLKKHGYDVSDLFGGYDAYVSAKRTAAVGVT